MDQVRTRIWNTRKEDGAPDRLVNIGDTSGVADMLRGIWAKKDE